MIPGAMALIPKRFTAFFSIPILRRAAFHVRRLTSGMDSSFFVRVGIMLVGFLIVASALVTVTERNKDGTSGTASRRVLPRVHRTGSTGRVTTVMGAGESGAGHDRRSATWSAGC